ncbi:hypothetical protein FG996_22985, partial [Escherichia coli]|nr:hypothetical protein [Escherichia coli]
CKTGTKPAAGRHFQRQIVALDDRFSEMLAVIRQSGEVGSGAEGNDE